MHVCLKPRVQKSKSAVQSMSEVQNTSLKAVVFCLSLKPMSSYNTQNSKSEVESLKSEVRLNS